MTEDQKPVDHADKDGHFRRAQSSFRNAISADPSSAFPAESGRYLLYVNYGCPWAHRTSITRILKGMDDIVELVEVDGWEEGKGWKFTGTSGPDRDPLYGFEYMRQLYEKASPGYEGGITVPALWDKKKETIVNNESSEIIRMFYTEFDHLLPEAQREANKAETGLFPSHLRKEIEAMNDWVYHTVNNGVYKTGFASSQQAYEDNVLPLFASLDRLEAHLTSPSHQPYLFGKHITEADIRLYTTIARFDVAYFTIFKCNLRMIRYEYPNLHLWLRRLYWDESEVTKGAFKNTTFFDVYRSGYTRAVGGKQIVPVGPLPDILPL